MSVQRPNNFRWETKSPSEQLIVANSSSMWIYDKDLEQATNQGVDTQVGNTPALLLSGLSLIGLHVGLTLLATAVGISLFRLVF